MSETKPFSPMPRKRRWLRVLSGIFGAVILLLIVAWFVVTSSAFIRSVILPRVSKAMNATVTIDSANIHPFSRIVLENLKVQTTGSEPLVVAREVRLRYHLFAIIRGDIDVDEIALVSPTINVVQNPDGTSNLDPLLKTSTSPKETKPPSPANQKKSKTLQIFLKKFALTDGTVRLIKNFGGGKQSVTELSNMNVALDNLKNSEAGKLQLSADVKMDDQPPAPASSGNLLAKISGNFNFTPGADFKTISIKGNTHFDVTQAGGALQDFSSLGADFDCDVTPTDIAQIALRFQKSGSQLGELRVSGLFDMQKSEGKLNVEILSLDKQVLNLFGASSGIDFGGTTINSTNQITFAKSGSTIAATGEFTVANLQLTRGNQTTPTIDARANYGFTVDNAAQHLSLQMLTVTADQNHQPLARVELSSPMNLSWNKNGEVASDSALEIGVTNLNLADWKPFLGNAISSGDFGLNAKLLSQSGGKKLSFILDSQIANVAAKIAGNEISQIGIDLQTRGQVLDFKQIKLDEFKVELKQAGQLLLTMTSAGVCEPASQNSDFQFQIQTGLPGLLKLAMQTNANVPSGTIELTGRVTQKGQTQNVTGKFSLAALTGRIGKNNFQNFGAIANFDVAKDDNQIQIQKVTGNLTGNGNAGGSFQLSGNYNLDKKSGAVTAKLAGFNQNGLRPFLEPMLADKKLVSVVINAGASAQMDAQNTTALNADLELTNFVVSDPAGQFPATPLGAKLQLDLSMSKQVMDLRGLKIALTPTSRAKNELQLAGMVDFSRSNAITGNLKLAADSLDVTRYYDLFEANSNAAAMTPALQPAAASPVAVTNTEPDAMNLPVSHFVFDASVGHFYLRDVDAANFQMTAKIDDNRVVIKPCQFTLNGAPVNAAVDLNLGVPGYEYDVSFDANRIPIAPLVNSFSSAYKNKASGDLIADAKIKGAGTTGKDLKETLAGNVDIVVTNANIDINSQNPNATKLTRFINRTITVVSTALGLNELLTSPLTSVDAHLKMGGGKIDATEIAAGSAAFQARLEGTITVADVLTNSTIDNWPVHVALARSSAQRLGWVPADALGSQTYFPLPDFATLTGTIGIPATKMDKVALAEIVGRSGLGIVNTLTGKAANGTTNTTDKIENFLNTEKTGQKLLNFFKKR